MPVFPSFFPSRWRGLTRLCACGQVALGITFAFSTAHAQDNAPPALTQPREVAPREAVARENNRPIPASRQVIVEQRRAMFEARLRAILINNGVAQSEAQDAVIGYLAREEQAKIPLREAARRLSVGLRRGFDEAKMRAQLAEYLEAIQADKKRRADAEKALDTQIEFSKNLRLEILLRLAGVLGDHSPSVNLNAIPTPQASREANNTVTYAVPYGGLAYPQTTNIPVAANRRMEGVETAPVPNLAAPLSALAPALSVSVETHGIARGVIEAKGDPAQGQHWLDLRVENGEITRYLPIYRPELRGFEPRAIAMVAQFAVGERVEIEWFWNEHRRIVTLKAFQPETEQTKQPK